MKILKDLLFPNLIFILAFSSSTFAMDKDGKGKTQYGYPALERQDFNSLAVQEEIPLFWYEDKKNPGIADPDEIIVKGAVLGDPGYLKDGAFTRKFEDAYKRLVDAKRKETLRMELNQGRQAIIFTDFSKYPANDREFVKRIMKAGQYIEELYQRQKGGLSLKTDIAANDALGQAIYERNQSVWCEAPETENSIFCSADPKFPAKKSDAYPQDLSHDAKMCEMLKSQPNGKELLSPFTVVRRNGDRFEAIPLTKVYGPTMKKVAVELREAAKFIDLNNEQTLGNYLSTAAEAFETNNWEKADEAWVKMNPDNSKWYIRIAPDEVYFDPCQEKAGFQLSFALVSKGSKEWKDKLNPLRDEMEKKMANLIGEPYKARKVSFQMPEFIDIVLNSGDARKSNVAVTGESLPNWGKIAQEGRGRTVAMTNFYTDPDSIEANRKKASLLLGPATMKYFLESRNADLITSVLHEASHNFGPHSDYKINVKGPSEIFGGRIASILEELKAQTGALFYVSMLKDKGLLTGDQVMQIYSSSMLWCFNHISKGMFTADGNPKTYSQLSAIQIGAFLEDGAIKRVSYTDPETKKEDWRFEVDFAKLPRSIERLMERVGKIKASGNLAGAKEFIDHFISGKGASIIPFDDIGKRYRSVAKENFAYSIKL
jgi:hypothetical protein